MSVTLDAATLPIRGQLANEAFGALKVEEEAKHGEAGIYEDRSLESSR